MARIVFCVQNESVPKDRRVWLEATTLVAHGHQVSVICPRDPGQERVETHDGVEILRFPAPLPVGGLLGYLTETLSTIFWTTVWCLRLSLSGAIDVLHAANPPDTFFLIGRLLRPFGTRFVFDQHDLCPELAEAKWGRRRLIGWVLRLMEKASYKSADLVIVPNNSYRRIALSRSGLDPSQVVVVRNGPAAAQRTATPPSRPPLVVTLAGVLGRHDGVEDLLEATATIATRRPGSIRIDIIGSGESSDRLQADARRLGVAELVSWAGWLTGEAYSRRLHSAHVAVSPDPDNPFSRVSTMMKIAEYVAGGLPCVVADLPENRVTAGEAALYFEPGNPADLARRLEQLIDAPERLEGLCIRAESRGPVLLWIHSAERLQASYRWLFGQGSAVTGDQLVVN